MRDDRIFSILTAIRGLADPMGAIMLSAEQLGESGDLAPEIAAKTTELSEAFKHVFVAANDLLLMTRGPLQ